MKTKKVNTKRKITAAKKKKSAGKVNAASAGLVKLTDRLINSMQDGFAMADMKGIHIEANFALCQMTGFSHEELVGVEMPFPYWPPEEYESIQAAFQKTLKKGAGNFELTFMRKNGERFPAIVSTAPVKNSKGEIISYIATIKDITERKRVEMLLRESEERLKIAQRLAQVGSWQWIAATDTVKWSEELYRINGRDPNFFAPTYAEMASYYTPESWKRLSASVEKALRDGETYELELEMVRPDGTIRYTFARGEADYDASGKIVGLHGTVQDITERKQMEKVIIDAVTAKAVAEIERKRADEIEKAYKELQAVKEMLVQSEKLASIGELSAGIAHELNNPLTGILGITRYYLKHKSPDSREYSDLKEVAQAGERMAKVIKGLTNFSRPSEGEMQELNCNDVIEALLGFGQRIMFGENVIVQKNYGKDLPLVKGDINQLQQVIVNIIDNAIDAMQRKGSLKIFTRVVAVNQKRFVEMEFVDSGCGISEDNLKNIFSPFFTTKRPDKGVGLGLSVAYSIIKHHNGEILIESPPAGQAIGAAFKVRIPVAIS